MQSSLNCNGRYHDKRPIVWKLEEKINSLTLYPIGYMMNLVKVIPFTECN